MSNKYTLSDFKNRISEEDYEFLKNIETSIFTTNLSQILKPNCENRIVFIGKGDEGKSTLRKLLSTIGTGYNENCVMGRVLFDNNLQPYSLNYYESNDGKNIPEFSRIIQMWKPDRNESMMINY